MVYTNNVRTGMVIKHIKVLNNTEFALSSVSLLCISARLSIIFAQGVADKIRILALNVVGRGRKYTAA